MTINFLLLWHLRLTLWRNMKRRYGLKMPSWVFGRIGGLRRFLGLVIGMHALCMSPARLSTTIMLKITATHPRLATKT